MDLLVRTTQLKSSLPIPCEAYPDEEISHYMALSPAQWEALLAIFEHHSENQRGVLGPRGDLESLWQACQLVQADPDGSADHSRDSPELGGHTVELSSDRFDDEDRSQGYEDDSDSEPMSESGRLSNSGYVQDPRMVIIDEAVPAAGEESSGCVQQVTSSEIEDLDIDMTTWWVETTRNAGLAITAFNKGSSATALMDSTVRHGDDSVASVSTSSDDNNDNADNTGSTEDIKEVDEGEDNADVEESVCSCDHCSRVQERSSSVEIVEVDGDAGSQWQPNAVS